MKKTIILSVMFSAVTAFATFDPQTIAFYSFNEGADGESALEAGFVNKIGGSSFQGSVLSTSEDATVLFSGDVPGCVTDDDGNIFADIRSLHSSGGASVELANLASKLSELQEWTLEYFFKVEADEYVSWSQLFKMDCGMTLNGEPGQFGYRQCYTDSTKTVQALRYFVLTNSAFANPTTYKNMTGYCDRWHHLALTYSSDKLMLYIDKALVETVNVTHSGSVAGKAVSVIGDTWKGRICALRASSCARTADKMLRTVNLTLPEAVDLGADTSAFYPFNEGVAGTSPEGVFILNAANPAGNAGDVTITAGELVYDDDVPGKYIFTNAVCGAKPWFTDPKSLRFGKAAGSASTSSVDLGGVMTDLAENGTGTVEFFWKMESAVTNESNWKVTFDFGSVFADKFGVVRPLGLFLPLANRENATYRRSLRLGADKDNKVGRTYTYTGNPEDDLWHHIAIVFDSGEVRMFCDYTEAGNIGGFETNGFHLASVEDIVDLRIGNGWFNGKVSCVRVSRKALAVDEMLRASNHETYDSDEVFVWHFDEKASGETFSSVSNSAENFETKTPGLYVAKQNTGYADDATVVPLTVGDTVTYPSAVRRRRIIRDGENGEIVSSCGSAVRMDVDPADELYSAQGMDFYGAKSQNITNSFTVETFFRYDQATWLEKVYSDPQLKNYPRMLVFGAKAGVYGYSWGLVLDDAAASAPGLGLWVKSHDMTGENYTGESITSLVDGKWHHVAVTYDSETLNFAVYLDYVKYLEIQHGKPLWGFSSDTHYRREEFHLGGRGLISHPFCGWFDSCRMRRGVHPVSSFYREERFDFGMQVIFR